MKQLLVQIDDDLAERVERVAPARSRKRSEFIRRALLRALWDLDEAATAEAYRRLPDSVDDAPLLPEVWEPGHAER